MSTGYLKMATTGEDSAKKREDKRKRDGEESEEERMRDMKRKKEEESEEERKRRREMKRKKEEESEDERKRRRGDDARQLEDQEPIPGSSQDAGSSSPYPKFSINRLIVHQMLGRGGFGEVVLASVPGQDTYVAIKGISKAKTRAASLQRERRVLLLARDCPFLCHLYAAQQSQDHAYFIMEYLSGSSLEKLIRMCGCLNIDNVRFYAAEITCGLQFLHRQNIVHRDIKTENIMLDREGHIRIIDLGLAQDGVTSTNKTNGVTGTFVYMAPEVLWRMDYDTAVDWWSLGIVVCRMSAGCSPFYYGTKKKKAYKSITTEEPNIPAWLPADLQHLIQELLCKDPDKRLGKYNNIRDHPFFYSINWEELEKRRARPPFRPFKAPLEDEDLHWPEFKTPLHPEAGFSYTSPSWDRMIRKSQQ
ncbi:protein kinase C delta type-like [Dendropsophus ebraccatus]|uniref:protein kinase C delta type-like n=1 Tax=Dendropsophus ebraccatus TaxID=150705 RepID=UPI003831BD77